MISASGMCVGLAGPRLHSCSSPGEGRDPGAPPHPLTFLFCVLHSLRLPPRGRCWQNLQPNHWPVSLQGRRDRHHLQPLRQGLPAEPLPHRALHQYVRCWGPARAGAGRQVQGGGPSGGRSPPPVSVGSRMSISALGGTPWEAPRPSGLLQKWLELSGASLSVAVCPDNRRVGAEACPTPKPRSWSHMPP